MKLFSYLYTLFENLAHHRLGVYLMCANSFAESVFWPIPPDLMLVPMCLCNRRRTFWYAFLTVAFSVMGAIVGYYLGYLIYDPYIADIVSFLHYEQHIETVRNWLTRDYGILMIFVGAFTPIPYKVIAVGTGLVAAESVMATGSTGMLNILCFVLVSFVGRGLRFFLEATVIYIGGEKMEKTVKHYIDVIGWLCVLAIAAFILYKVFG
ncbi:MAG: YqaA family protein [Succinivibrio sp.]